MLPTSARLPNPIRNSTEPRNQSHARTQRTFHHVRRAQPPRPRRLRQRRGPARRLSTGWPPTERCSRTPIATARSACRAAPASPPAATSTPSATGTTPSPTAARRRHGGTGCTTPGIAAIRSASCIIAAATIRTASTTKSFRSTCSRARATCRACCAARRRRATAPISSPAMPGAGNSTYLQYDRDIRDEADRRG